MRAHSQRRLIWILNILLGAGLLAVIAWIVLDVRTAVADPAYLRPSFAADAVERFRNEPATNRSALKSPVSQKELEEIDRPEFKSRDGKRFHWIYSGRMPPPPPAVAEAVEIEAPIQDDLSRTGRVAMLMYVAPSAGEAIARETVIFWEFADDKSRKAFQPGEIISPDPTAESGIRIENVRPKSREARTYEIDYAVYKAGEDEPVSRGVYLYEGTITVSEEVAGRVVMTGGTKPVAEDAEAGPDGAALVEGGVTSAVPEEAAPEPGAINPSVVWEDVNRVRVEFDDATVSFFRGRDAETVASTVKTQVARDTNGNVLGLQITGISGDTPAERFDVKPGDILVSIDGQPVKSRQDAMNIAQGLSPDVRLVKVVVDRRGRLITFNIDPRDPKTRRQARYLDNE